MLILNSVIAWFGTWFGRAALGGGLVASYFGWLYVHDLKIWNNAVADTNTKIEKVTNDKVSLATSAGHKSTGNSRGVLFKYYRD